MKSIFFLILSLFLASTAHAQEAFHLRGKLVNEHREPLELMYLSLVKSDSTVTKKALTDSLGKFDIRAETGTYFLNIHESGIENLEINLIRDLDLGEIIIRESQELQGVTVTARKKLIEQQVDRLIFYVENATIATGGTALDALKATPTVRVQNDQVSIVGKGEVLVMVDDHLQRMPQEELANFLKSIPADNIKSIEVITTPPAKYDAEGNSGMIHIRLKKARPNSWNANFGTAYTQKTYAGGTIQGFIRFNSGKLALGASLSGGKQGQLTSFDSKTNYPEQEWDQTLKNHSNSQFLGLGFDVDYQLTKNWTSGISYLGNVTGKTSYSNPLTVRTNRQSQSVDSYIDSKLDASAKPGMHSLNWHHAVKLDSLGKNLTIDFDRFNYRKSDRNSFSGNILNPSKTPVPGTFFAATNNNTNRIQNYSGKADVSLPYSWADLSFGGKFSYTHTSNDLDVFDQQTGEAVLNTTQSNTFRYKEQNEALYFAAKRKLSSRWETQIGLRMEATQTEGYSQNLDQTNRNHYLKLFPTAYLSYTLNDSNSFSLTYSRRISRPNFDYLNPFVVRTNPYDYSEGNPFLKPSYITNLELTYLKNQNWVNSFYFSRVSDIGQEVSLIDPATNITRSTPMNYADSYQLGFSTYYHLNRFPRWNSYTGFNINYLSVHSKTSFIASASGFNGYIYSNNDVTLNKTKSISLGVNYGLQLPGLYQVFHISTLHILDISAKFLLLDGKLSATVVLEDVLNGQRPAISYTSNGIQTSFRSYGDTRQLRISLSYQLGNNHLKQMQRTSGNEEEQGRI